MKVFLAGTASHENVIKNNTPKYILESFQYIKSWQVELLKQIDDFLLDSGAFTFIQNNYKSEIEWDEYIERYAAFINECNINHFFELDIDSVIGYDKVIEYRHKLEKLTNKQCIPVWHKSRGVEEYKRHCQEYPYVSIGGYVIKELNANDYKAFPSMINYAHEKGAKVHCLGFTSTTKLNEYRFDSVDSTTWINGARFANVCWFRNNVIEQIHWKNKRCTDVEKLSEHNLKEWIKFQNYADKYL